MTQNIDSFQTARLRAERIEDSHLSELIRLWQDERVMASVGGVRSGERTGKMFQNSLDHWTQFGFGRWAWREIASGRFVGLCGLRCLTLEGWPEVSLGYLLYPEFWGKGLATEAAQAVLGIAFDRLGMESIIALTTPDNAASRRVMEKSGMQYNRETLYENIPHVLYQITHAQWARLQPPAQE